MARESKRVRDERRFGKPERLADLALTSIGKQDWSLPEFATDGVPARMLDFYWESVGHIRQALAQCPVIDATGACRAYWDHPKDVWEHDDFPNVAPPFGTFFVESAHPGMITVGDGRRVSPADWCPDRWGFLFRASPAAADFPAYFEGPGIEAIPLERRWDVRADLIVARGGVPCFYPVIAFLPVSATGELVRWPTALGGGAVPPEDREQIASFWASLLKPILFALSFLHCKNVISRAVDPEPRLNRERVRHGLAPFVRYHVLDIEPMRRVLRTEGNSETVGLKRAMHICRGHFATYTEERPLFGRLSGTFWVPAHIRGSTDQGVVVSDYRIEQ